MRKTDFFSSLARLFGIKQIILDVLESYSDRQMNLASEAAREEIAEKITEEIKTELTKIQIY